MSSAAGEIQRRPASVRARILMVIYTVLVGMFGYVAVSGEPVDAASTVLVAATCLLLALHATIHWLEDTRPGFAATAVGRRLATARFVGVIVVFVGSLSALFAAGAWVIALFCAVLGGSVLVLIVPGLLNRVLSGGDPVAAAVRRPGRVYERDSRVVHADELEPGMRLLVARDRRTPFAYRIETVEEHGDIVRVTASSVDESLVLNFSVASGDTARVLDPLR